MVKNYGTEKNLLYAILLFSGWGTSIFSQINANGAQLGSDFPDSVALLTTIVQGKTVVSSKNLYVSYSLIFSGSMDQGSNTLSLGSLATFKKCWRKFLRQRLDQKNW
jgi:hypothetical protein